MNEPDLAGCHTAVLATVAATLVMRSKIIHEDQHVALDAAAVPLIIATRMVDDVSAMMVLAKLGHEAQVHSLYAGALEAWTLVTVTAHHREDALAWLQAAASGHGIGKNIAKRMNRTGMDIRKRGAEAVQYLHSRGAPAQLVARLNAVGDNLAKMGKMTGGHDPGYDLACRAKHGDPGYCLLTQLAPSADSGWTLLDGPRPSLVPQAWAWFFTLQAASRLLQAMSVAVTAHPIGRRDPAILDAVLDLCLQRVCCLDEMLREICGYVGRHPRSIPVPPTFVARPE